jgi:putative transposase
VDSGETARTHPTELRPVEEIKEAASGALLTSGVALVAEAIEVTGSTSSDIGEIDDLDWKEAQRLFSIIQPLLETPNRRRADVAAVAAEHGIEASTVYRWISNYRAAGHLSGLIPRKRGRKKGTKLLSPEQEAVIADVLENSLDPQAQTPVEVIRQISDRFKEVGIAPVHPNTIRNRIAEIPLRRRLFTRGNKELAKQLFEPRPGESPDGKFPLEVVQIDHVQLDIKVVDVQTRRPIEARPWATFAIDTYSRMIVGYFLSLLRPSAFSTGVCLYMAMMPKRDLLARLDLPGRWPVYGKFRKVKADNAREFKGSMLTRACDEHNIDLELRPVKTPHYGAYIERMVGNVNRELHKKRGTTHRAPDVSPDYDSSAKAIYTLAELEAEVVDWIVNQYHVSRHSGLNCTPLRKWEQGLLGDNKTPGVGLPLIPIDTEKLRLDFLPFERRTIHPYGVELGRMYYHEVLNRWINATDPENPKEKRKFIFRYDPRTIRCIWFWDPDAKRYFPIPVRDTTWPDISWSEYDEYRKAMTKEGFAHVDEAAIRGYVERSKLREDRALVETQKARRSFSGRSAPRFAIKESKNSAPGAVHYAATPMPEIRMVAKVADHSGETFESAVEAFDEIDV